MSDFYQSQDLKYIEKAVLLEDIILPELPKFVVQPAHSHGVGSAAGKHQYHSPIELPYSIVLYEDVVGKFSIPITTPLNDNYGDPSEKEKTNKSVKNLSNTTLKSSGYTESNYLELTIPKYIVLNFLDKIPKGTIFVACFVGGGSDIDDIKIIGVY